MLDLHPFNPQFPQNYDKINLSNCLKSNLLRKELSIKKNKIHQFAVHQANFPKVSDHLASRYSDNLNLSKSNLKINNIKHFLKKEDKLPNQIEEKQDYIIQKANRHITRMLLKPFNNSINQHISLNLLPKINLPSFPENIMIQKQKTFREKYANDLNKECKSTNITINNYNNNSNDIKKPIVLDAKCNQSRREPEKIIRSSSTNTLFSSYRTISIKEKVTNAPKMFHLSLCGTKKVNQDSYVALPNHFNLDNYNIMAIFDGHGQNGHFISQLARRIFIQFFSQSNLFYIPRKFTSSPNLISLKNHIKEEDIYKKIAQQKYKILRDGFALIENEINASEYEKDFSGSTGCAVFVVGKHAICVNIGDSRAIIISNKGKIVVNTLSIDHKPEDRREKERILKCGGEVKKIANESGLSNSPYRVWVKDRNYPGLAMSRSFGDFIAKEIGVIAEPDIWDQPISREDMYIVVASDGIWEWLSNEDVERIVTPFYLVNNIEGATEGLISAAKEHFIKIGEYIDDITVTILFLNQK